MGCVQAKGGSFTPTRNLDRLKNENLYVRGGHSGEQKVIVVGSKVVHIKDLKRDSRPQDNVKNVAVGINGSGEDRKISREGEKEGDHGGNVSRRISIKQIAGDDFVEGWPKWLVDNIPRDALAGLDPKSADSYDKLAKVGQGTYSNVYKALDRDTGKIVALKKIRFNTSEPESVKFMAREIIILRKLDHPNVIKLEGLATSRMQYSLYLVFDFMLSDLTRIISRPEGRLTEPQVKSYMQQLLSGLQHCHERGILHRDIKASNLLIDKNGMLKIADFGLANFYQPKPKRPLTSRVVTLWYRAPELLLGSTDYGVGIDLWSAGCLLGEMFEGRPIMPGRNEIEQLHKIFKLCGSPPEDYWKKVKPPTTFRPPPHYKPCFRESFPNLPDSATDLLATLLSLDPAYRGTATRALESEFFNTSPLACDLSGLPVLKIKEDDLSQYTDRIRIRASKAKQVSRRNREGHKEKVSFPETVKEDYGSSKEPAEISLHSQEIMNSASSSSSSAKQGRTHERSPPSPRPAFHSRQGRSAKTEAHPNALKNIQNYPLLLASLTEAASRFEQNRLSLNHRSISTTDFRNLDTEKISKLFGLEDQ
ncbi:unnamed protein product [Coffea canephora]|uniref:Protein kinase domain-containing protein n=1 Tax=Coffea canephora TaxID=49390 RepID=A0A068UX77_COFCA|nr:unnamed protein product [Coffea canephora]